MEIDSEVIIGVYSIDSSKFLSTIKENINNKICYIPELVLIPHEVITVIDYINYIIRYLNIELKNREKKLSSSFKIIGFDATYINRNIKTLSSSELKLIQIISFLLSNKEIIILEEPFRNFDLSNEKRLKKIMDKMTENYKKTVIIVSKDTNILYKYTKRMLFIKSNGTGTLENTKDMFEKIEFLEKNNIPIPEIVSFIARAKRDKKVKIDYHIDIRDLIKDIYKHV